MKIEYKSVSQIYTIPAVTWVLLALALAVAGIGFHTGLGKLLEIWFSSEEYSYGVLIPLISAFLIWQRKEVLQRLEFKASWAGVALVFVGGLLHLVGQLSTLFIIQQYAVLIILYGLVLAFTGPQVFRQMWMALAVLVFTIPLPEFLLQAFSTRLQLISSWLGVAVIRLFGISVYLEGNVIDLGSYKLQVAEACSGLRYLFPLMTLGFVMACLFNAPRWQRLTLFVSSIPVTILMNSLRIGAIGVLVEHWGTSMAEGFLHDFEGWVMFMASTAVLLLEIVLFTRFTRPRRSWREAFGFDWPAPVPRDALVMPRPLQAPFVAALVLLILFASLSLSVPGRKEISPARQSFVEFSMDFSPWSGRRQPLDPVFIDALKFDDYLNADLRAPNRQPVNLYVSYYASQRQGRSVHSPRSCIPGGGWHIADLSQRTLDLAHGRRLPFNRVLVEYSGQKQIVYYWFQQRGRLMTNEYKVKWFIFWDSLARSRSDGALVRISAPLPQGVAEERVDAELQEFARLLPKKLSGYIPD